MTNSNGILYYIRKMKIFKKFKLMLHFKYQLSDHYTN